MSCAASIENASLAAQLSQRTEGRRNVYGNVLNVMISLLWLKLSGWVLYKTTQWESSYQSTGTCSTGAALVSPLKKLNPVTLKQKQTELCTDGGRGSPHPHFFHSLCIFLGQPLLTNLQSKQCSVNTGRNKGKHRFVVMCVVSEWPCVDIPDIKPLVLFFFLAGWHVLRSLVPHPGLTCWAMTTKQMASIAAHCDLWLLVFELPCREGLSQKPSWFNNIFSPEADKALSCLTPVVPNPLSFNTTTHMFHISI